MLAVSDNVDGEPSADEQETKVFVVDGVLGLPEPWEIVMRSSQPEAEREMDLVEESPEEEERLNAAFAKALKIKFYACGKKDELLPDAQLKQQLKQQVRLVQLGYAGELRCDKEIYQVPHTNIGLHFDHFDPAKDLEYIDDVKCNSCDHSYHDLWRQYLKEEKDKAKVLVCNGKTSILGVSSFPGDKDRGTLISVGTLPGGSIKKYNEGRTLIHELGHYLGLLHTFQDGCSGKGDQIQDTATESRPFFGCPEFGKAESHYQTCNKDPETAPGQHKMDPVHNYMDYSDDRCMCGFTKGQKSRIRRISAQGEAYIPKGPPPPLGYEGPQGGSGAKRSIVLAGLAAVAAMSEVFIFA
jgi:hypothetical protein